MRAYSGELRQNLFIRIIPNKGRIMKFSMTNSIKKKIFAILGIAITSTVTLLIIGLLAVKIVNVCVIMTSCERDHSVNFFQAFSKLEKFTKSGDERDFEKFRQHLNTASGMTKSFSQMNADYESKGFSAVLKGFEAAFPRLKTDQLRDMIVVSHLLSSHGMVIGLVGNAANGYKIAQDLSNKAESYRKAGESDRPALLDKMYRIYTDMDEEAGTFSAGVRELSDWAVNLVIKLLVLFFVMLFVFTNIFARIIANSITRPINSVVNFADVVARGDLSQRLEAISKDETRLMTLAMNEICDKVGTNISHAANASRRLAEGATQQAAAIEETAASLEEMAAKAKMSADNATEADNLMKDAAAVVRSSNQSMERLTSSMEEISEASGETQKIVKTIDEIAFQTNLLALNAAVEAARAGEAGGGFAVVADEVRNLAMRSANAARDTAALIEDTVNKVQNGSDLVNATAEGFGEVTRNATKVGELLSEIAIASREQARGVEEINSTAGHMDEVVQQNAASAQELASGVAMFKTS